MARLKLRFQYFWLDYRMGSHVLVTTGCKHRFKYNENKRDLGAMTGSCFKNDDQRSLILESKLNVA